MVQRAIVQLMLGLLASSMSLGVQAVDLTGAGASLPYPIYAKWASRYHKETGHRVNYQSIGSGGGQQQIIAGTVDFGASDDPMGESDLNKHQLFQFPAIVGAIVPVVNIKGIKPGELKLSGAVLAQIYLARITRWDDPAIQTMNPDLKLPSRDIVVVHRADGSGTTFGWTNYLSKMSPAWKEVVGEGKAVKWPVGQGGKGNEGVAAYVRQLKNSIGYVEYAYAKQNGLSWTQLQNREGYFVQPSLDSFSAAAANADWSSAAGMGVILTDEPGADSWPVTSASFILVPKMQRAPVRAKEVLNFFDWAFKEGNGMAKELDYVPLPTTLIEQIQTLWKAQLRQPDGSPLWP